MRVCAHMNLGPHVHRYVDAPSIAFAVAEFYKQLETHYGVVDGSIADIRGLDEMPALDLYYPACGHYFRAERDMHCSDEECFHGYPSARYQVGPRGGIRKVTV